MGGELLFNQGKINKLLHDSRSLVQHFMSGQPNLLLFQLPAVAVGLLTVVLCALVQMSLIP